MCTIKPDVPYSQVCFKDFPQAGSVNVAGRWNTTWTASNGCSGTATLQATQTENRVSGKGSVASSCLVPTAGPVKGTVNGSQVTLMLTDPRGVVYTTTFQGTVTADKIVGTFQTALGSGTFTSTRSR
jgi:hypothetical protein